MAITVSPREFRFVNFDAAAIEDAATAIVEQLGMTDRDIDIVIDETTPLAKVAVELGPPIVVHADSGAFEDLRRPRHLSERNVMLALGRVLLRARDRLDGTFGEAPGDDDISLAQTACWDTYAAGRLSRLGHSVNQQRYRYNFRNRHGFSDSGDSGFDRLWSSDRLTWNDLVAASNSSMVPKPIG